MLVLTALEQTLALALVLMLVLLLVLELVAVLMPVLVRVLLPALVLEQFMLAMITLQLVTVLLSFFRLRPQRGIVL